jgi:quercetin dioxygenase-like cupin family protein
VSHPFGEGDVVEYVGETNAHEPDLRPGERGIVIGIEPIEPYERWEEGEDPFGVIVSWPSVGANVIQAKELRIVMKGEGPTSLSDLISRIDHPWRPVVVAEANGFQMKVAKLHGEFPWHVHEQEDELFQCVEGSFRIEMENGQAVELRAGVVFVVPKGTRHRPVADDPAVTVLFERAETKQYGD